MNTLPSLDALASLAREAGDAIMRIYRQDFTVEHKEDDSPVTEADIAAHHIIEAGLTALTPEVPIISEEHDSYPDVDMQARFWMVDPLDGTKSFVRKSGEFTVNIALVEKCKPVLGVIWLPVQEVMYAGMADAGAWREDAHGRQAIRTRIAPQDGLDVLVSHAHKSPKTDVLLADMPVRKRIRASSSLKFCVVAEGKADLYPRMGPTMEWDTAAGQAIVEAAGGRVITPEGEPFTYNKKDFANGPFIVWGK